MYVGVIYRSMNDSQRDVYLRLLSDPVKRRVVDHLVDESDERATVGELADRLLGTDADHGVDGAGTRSQLAIELHHAHLPKLAAHDVVAFDPDAGAVTYLNPAVLASISDFRSEDSALDLRSE
jgi:hypothetical protein